MTTIASTPTNTLVSVDPSVNNIGIAILQIHPKAPPQWQSFLLQPTSDDLRVVCNYIARSVEKRAPHITELVLEYPQFMTSTKGQIAAQRGYTLGLAAVCGYLPGYFRLNPMSVKYYTPSQWKGQKPKKATEAAFKRLFEADDSPLPSEHEIDAIMMLHFHATERGYI